jgi:hypothetical protein
MKINQFNKIFIIVLLLATTACKKYGYNIPDGYPDNSANVATGTIDTNLKVIDKSKYAQAKVFPGLVDQSEPRVKDAKFTIDLNYSDQTADILRIQVAPEPQFSTGYYAAPGELVKIVVPQGIEGLVVQIGGQTDNLNGKSPLLRDPLIYMRQQLYAGNNYVRNLYGGTIYIRASHAYPNPVEFTISNAVVSPDFILNTTNEAAWLDQVKASKVPWLELRAKRVIFLIPRDKVIATLTSARPFTNPQAVLNNWNQVFDLDYNSWMGLSDNSIDVRDRSPQGPWRGVLDIQLSAGYGHNGFPFVGLNDSNWFGSMTSLNLNGAWGTYHEFGHNMQQTKVWSWSTLGETSNNLFSFKVANRHGTDYNILHNSVSSGFPLAIAYASTIGAKNFDVDAAMNDPFKRMTPFVQIFEKYGYGAMTYLYTEARHADRLNNSDITMHNFVYEKLSNYAQTDLSAFFDAWGINISSLVINKVSAKYPLLTKQIWTYDPLAKTGGTATIVPTIFSVAPAGGTVSNLIDNSTATTWLSTVTTYPFNIVYSQNVRTPIKGMFFTLAATAAQRPKDIDISISDDNVTYTILNSTTIPNVLGRWDYLFPAGVVNPRYIKVTLKNGWTASKN